MGGGGARVVVSVASVLSSFCCSPSPPPPSSLVFSSVLCSSPAGAGVTATAGTGAGVATRLGTPDSSPSPMTNSGSNSDGSGSFPVGIVAAPSCSFLLRRDGDIFLEPDLGRVDVLVRGDAAVEPEADETASFCLACSSWMRLSTASLKRWLGVLVKMAQRLLAVAWWMGEYGGEAYLPHDDELYEGMKG